MAPRASWKGFLRISLVTCPVALFPAVSGSERISFNRINRKTGQRVRQMNVDGKSGEKVESDDIVKGYEVEKGRYVLIEDEDLDAIQVEASKIISVTEFVDAAEIDPFFLETPYYMAPDGAMAEETYRVIRTAMEETGTAGIGSLVLSSRERRVLLSPMGRGIALTTLRAKREVRSSEAYFDEVGDGAVEGELLDMAKMLIDARRKPFETAELVDKYEEAVRQLVMAKAKGETPVYAPAGEPAAVIDLMKALKESLASEGSPARKPAARGKRAGTSAAAGKAPKSGKAAAVEPAKPARRRKAS